MYKSSTKGSVIIISYCDIFGKYGLCRGADKNKLQKFLMHLRFVLLNRGENGYSGTSLGKYLLTQ
ncbi:hypothetical protein SBA3_2030004 [Candidatus Sulfopaludibacter sp. SbA3]|nr:hypothetical protein SBA3_2030004 [Candidatus Sulfopaludibacter sp. SbA3]